MSFDGSSVIETETLVLFWQPPGVFSQWTAATFEVEGVRYGCAEQFMMAEKARLFADQETLARILATASPKQQKALGRQVQGYENGAWEAARLDVVVRGNRAKFSQNAEMRAALLATGDKTLVEASPYDRIWGIGLRADDPRALDPSTWRGQNLLGQALELVRAELRAR
ncbi:MAG: NADAR family protein [Planctomycetota bacterium]